MLSYRPGSTIIWRVRYIYTEENGNIGVVCVCLTKDLKRIKRNFCVEENGDREKKYLTTSFKIDGARRFVLFFVNKPWKRKQLVNKGTNNITRKKGNFDCTRVFFHHVQRKKRKWGRNNTKYAKKQKTKQNKTIGNSHLHLRVSPVCQKNQNEIITTAIPIVFLCVCYDSRWW